MANAEAFRTSAESAIRDDGDASAQTGTDDCTCERRHLRHTGTTDGTLVAQYDDIPGFNQATPYRVRPRLLRVETTRRTSVLHSGLVRDLGHCTIRGKRSLQDRA